MESKTASHGKSSRTSEESRHDSPTSGSFWNGIETLIFDLDGVLTRTAGLHAAAWKEMFDQYLQSLESRKESPFRPFDPEDDYRRYVDGKPRYQGVAAFLESRGIELPWGSEDDPPEKETVCGLGNRKNRIFGELLRSSPVEVFENAVTLVRNAREMGFKVAVVSSSRNTPAILESARIGGLFDVVLDGNDLERLGLSGKPSPDIFLEAARRLDSDPKRCAVFEDAISGVQAGRNGGFGLVIGVAGGGDPKRLREEGADLVVRDLGRPSLEPIGARPSRDGTSQPSALARVMPVAVISGRDLADVRRRVGLEGLTYAGSHGFEIQGPDGRHFEQPEAAELLPRLDAVEDELRRSLDDLEGVQVERKRFSVAVHVRRASEEDAASAEERLSRLAEGEEDLRLGRGHKVFELQPKLDWSKGHALRRIMDETTQADSAPCRAFYIGDDTTDEDAFEALDETGVGIVVTEKPRRSAADFALADPREVRRFLQQLMESRPEWESGAAMGPEEPPRFGIGGKE